MTFAEFAKEYGLSKRTAIRYENTNYLDNPTPLIASKICKTFNIDPDSLSMFDFNPNSAYIAKIRKYLSDEFKSIHTSSIEHFQNTYLKKNKYDMDKFVLNDLWQKYEYPMNQTEIIGSCISPNGSECAIYYLPPRTSNELTLYPASYDFSNFEHFPDFVKIFLELEKNNKVIPKNCFVVTPSSILFREIKRNKLFNRDKDFIRNITLVYSNYPDKIETAIITGKQI